MSNELPHKWPGMARIIAALAEMRIAGTVPFIVKEYHGLSRSKKKAQYKMFRYWYRAHHEYYQQTQKGNYNGKN